MVFVLFCGLVAISILSYCLYGAVLRLYLSPVASVPGPKLAIVSFWYEFYYDVVCQGRYTWKIAELHKQYGPIIRINPFEVHIDDPDFYDEVYVVGSKRKSEQWSWTVSISLCLALLSSVACCLKSSYCLVRRLCRHDSTILLYCKAWGDAIPLKSHNIPYLE